MTAPRAGSTNERGSTLVMVLVFITVVAVSGAAVLGLQHAVFRAQTALVGKNTVDSDAQNALTTAVELLRRDSTGTMGRDDPNLAGCNDKNTASALSDYTDVSGAHVIVHCKPLAGSGNRGGGGGASVPRSVIVTLGGATGDGNDSADSTDNAIPFCDDFQTSGGCEAGMYVYRGLNTVTGETGWFVSGNGSSSTDPVIKSNSSVIVDNTSAGYLKVDGGVWARRVCTPGRVLANYTLANNTPDCTTEGEPDYTNRRPMTIDDCSGNPPRVDGVDCFPWQPRTSEIDSTLRTLTEPAWVPAGTPARMQPVTLPATCPTTGYLVLDPGYYSTIKSLDTLMACNDTLIHFTPGVYYLDNFDTSAGSTDVWTAPNGAQPTEVVGGLPPTTGGGAWLPCNNGQTTPAPPPGLALGQCPKQPPKKMHFRISTTATSSKWARPDQTLFIDDVSDEAITNNQIAQIEYLEPWVPLPERVGTTVQSLSFRIRHKAPDGTVNYGTGYPKLRVWLPSAQWCDLFLQKTGSTDFVNENFVLLADAAAGETANSCSAKSPGWDTSLSQVHNNPSYVNGVKVDYVVASKNASTNVRGGVDGLEMGVTFTGRPAPDFPGACDSSQPGSGVQFILGNTTRISWGNTSNSSIELCGTRGGAETGGQYATVLYGVPEHGADPPREYTPTAVSANVSGSPNVNFPAMVDSAPGTAGTIDAGDPTGWSCPVVDVGCALSGAMKSDKFLNNAQASITFNTPPAQNGATDFVPRGSVITGVELRVRHAEGAPGSSGTNWISPDTSHLGQTTLSISPGTGGVGTSYGENAASLSIALPKCDDFRMPAGDPSCDFRFGYPSENPDDPWYPSGVPFQERANWCWGATSNLALVPPTGQSLFSTAAPAGSKCDWFKSGSSSASLSHRALRDAMSTPEAWNNAKIKIQWQGIAGGANVAWLDGIELKVHFRPPGTLRPLHGCVTTRSSFNPHANAATGTNLGGHLVGVDQDWGPLATGVGDKAYTGGNGTGDTEGCALLRLNQPNGTGNVKVHLQGVVYAPTAALDFSSTENRAPFVTDGLVARQLTATLWSSGSPVDSFGDPTGDRANRRVWIWVEQSGKTIAKAKVELDDNGGHGPFARTQTVTDYLLRPEDATPP